MFSLKKNTANNLKVEKHCRFHLVMLLLQDASSDLLVPASILWVTLFGGVKVAAPLLPNTWFILRGLRSLMELIINLHKGPWYLKDLSADLKWQLLWHVALERSNTYRQIFQLQLTNCVVRFDVLGHQGDLKVCIFKHRVSLLPMRPVLGALDLKHRGGEVTWVRASGNG